jgi:hypothetical protein
MNSNTPKRVSFGSTHGSMVETLIIDDNMPTDEKTFYQNTLLDEQKNNNQQNNNTGSNENNNITESSDNPFQADGELSKKAEYILKHSTISRTEIRISDPDLSRGEVTEEKIEMTNMSQANAAPKTDIKLKENGKVEAPLKPQSVEVEVGTANASQPQPLQAEQVKLKDPKCKCCVVM